MNNEVEKDTNKDLIDEKSLKKKKFGKGFFIGLGITCAVEAVISVCVFLAEFYGTLGHLPSLSTIQMNNMLTDIFMVPAILTLLFYAIVFVSREGAFDAIAYSSKLVFYSIFAKNIRKTKLPATYGDYREMKRGKERSSFLFLIFAAIPWIIVGIVFCCLSFPTN